MRQLEKTLSMISPWLLSLLARISLGAAFLLTLLVARPAGATRKRPFGTVVVVGSFHNRNWFTSHINPMLGAAQHVYVITDSPVVDTEGLTYLCPPRWQQVMLTRAGAKLIQALGAARLSPDVIVGFHIFPCALIALIAGRRSGAMTVYESTSGPRELEGGGHAADNQLLRLLRKPSRLLQGLAVRAASRFDLVLVRGTKAKQRFLDLGVRAPIEVITGSVAYPDQVSPFEQRDIEVLFVGRLVAVKRLELLIRVVAELQSQLQRSVRTVVVGEGPEMERLVNLSKSSGTTASIEFVGKQAAVGQYFDRAKCFLLTSSSEGVSIAMLEAMCHGAVPVVANVGDLADHVEHGATGFLVDSDDPRTFAGHILSILPAPECWHRISQNARKVVRDDVTEAALSARWHELLPGSAT